MSEHLQKKKPSIGRRVTTVIVGFVLVVILSALLYAQAFGPVDAYAQKAQFVVTPDESIHEVAIELAKQGYVRSPFIFELAFLRATDGKGIREGGYEISKSMDAWTIASSLVEPPYFAWVKIPVGVRKEQIAEILTKALGWTDAQKTEWLTVGHHDEPELHRGRVFP
jgi:cell division protein YceG involved in septum cleavage